MDCKRCRVEIEEAGRGGLHGAAAGAHLAACAGCRAFSAGRASLRGLVADLARVDAPNDFEFRLRARLAAEGPGRARAGWQSYLPRAAWATAAAALLLAVGVSLRPGRTTTPSAAGGGSQPLSVAATTATSEQANEISHTPEVATGATSEVATTATPSNADVQVLEVAGEVGTKPKVIGRPVERRRRQQTVVPRAVVEEIATGAGGAERFAEHSRSVIGGTVIPLPVSAEERPLQVTFKDMQGASRVVRVDPVAFGSREPNFPGARVVNAAHKQGVW